MPNGGCTITGDLSAIRLAPQSIPLPSTDRVSAIHSHFNGPKLSVCISSPSNSSRAKTCARFWRSAAGFPWATVLLGVGILAVVGLLTWAVYAMFGRTNGSAPEPFTNSHGLRLVKVEGGTFRMGSPKEEPGRRPDEGPDHDVTIRGSLLISTTEVTNGQFVKVMGVSPSRAGGVAARAANLPVESVTWDEANDFCKKLTEQDMVKVIAQMKEELDI